MITTRAETADVHHFAARKPFKGYGPGKRKRSGTAVVKDMELSEILYLWEKYSNFSPIDIPNFSASAIEKFSLILDKYENMQHFSVMAGSFLSDLIKAGEGENFVIHTDHLAEPIENLCATNGKNILVKGDLGDMGQYMKGGSIVVEGNAKEVGLCMEGGNITIQGNVYTAGTEMVYGNIVVEGDATDVGWGMEDGNIVIKGNALRIVGRDMEGGSVKVLGNAGIVGYMMDGGEIHIEGGYEKLEIGEDDCGRIYHRGELIVDK